MREIKFRVWDKALKYMHICGENVHDSCYYDENNNFYYYNLQNGEGSSEYGDYILMQYTGLHDKNGKEIYEGDIIQHLYWDCDETDYYKVEWDNEILGFVFKSTINNSYLALDDTYSDDTGEYEIVVIGNIYDNPELLEEV